MYVQEKINILLSISSNYFLLYFDICLNIHGFVYSEFCMYHLGLCRNNHVLTKCNLCLPAIEWFYIQHCPSFLPISKLDAYLCESRVSKIFTLGPLLQGRRPWWPWASHLSTTLFEPRQANLCLRAFRHDKFQLRMPCHSEGPGIWHSVWRFLLTHCLYEWAAEVLARLRGCAGSPEPSLLA